MSDHGTTLAQVFWKEGASGSPQVWIGRKGLECKDEGCLGSVRTKGAFTSELNLASMYEFAAPGFRGVAWC